jgi:hypothetical protein
VTTQTATTPPGAATVPRTRTWVYLGLLTAGTAAGETVSRIMALFAHVFGALY